MGVSGVILAAGASTRLGRPKQLLDLCGEPVIRVVARNALSSRLSEVILVTGGSADRVGSVVADLSVRVVVNADFQNGQSTSLIAGLGAIDTDADGVLFLLGDQPEVDSPIIDALIKAFETGAAPIVQPVFAGVPSNPVLFSRELFPELRLVEGDAGARAVVQKRRAEILPVPFPDIQPPGDLDTEADYQAMLTQWAARKATQS